MSAPDLPPEACALMGLANPVHHAGINLSVRRGTRWLGVAQARLALPDGHLSPPVALTTRAIVFDQLRDADLLEEHDPACRSVIGLLAVMRQCYPGFQPEETVTLCWFVWPD